MKTNHLLLILLFIGIGISGSCRKSFLDVNPTGGLNKFMVASDEGINALLIGAYSMLDGVSAGFQPSGSGSGWESASSNWLYGSVRGLEANVGSDAGMQSDVDQIQTFSETAWHSYLNFKWREVYDAISRCNSVIPVINQALKQGSITLANAESYLKQARALRGWYHFEAWRMWRKIPYVNLVRARAANPAGFVKESDGITPAATYEVKPYPSFPDQVYALTALQMERKLELGMEGHRWFDLVRWGTAVNELNRVLDYEKKTSWGNSMYGNAAVGQENIAFPIPQYQIDLSNGRLIQNL
jgi:hypothetical protein